MFYDSWDNEDILHVLLSNSLLVYALVTSTGDVIWLCG